jgi:hypothetical protein
VTEDANGNLVNNAAGYGYSPVGFPGPSLDAPASTCPTGSQVMIQFDDNWDTVGGSDCVTQLNAEACGPYTYGGGLVYSAIFP